ncbi:MAG: hypothetical protein HQK66_11870 [Desulfamplus sp.]|nr:hypothetical protein [Desulfamplus sp.]
MNIQDIKKDINIVNSVNWEMTPEEAIALHLEWGPLRDVSYYNSRDSNNETVYFVINTWKNPPIVTLLRRKGFDSEDLAEFNLPARLEKKFLSSVGYQKGVFAVEGEVKEWLQKELAC